ncbi:MAG TPA: MBL fold metallo-hydrolase [Gemmatimonadales bacterium]|nr:MBL fold metallo-hydrolase [Gemmatimonadales bacterium]
MKVVQVPNGMFAENCYLVLDEEAGECAVVDPGEEAGLILHKIAETGAKPVGIWLTHAHLDHVLGVARVAAETGAPVWLHPADRPLYDAVPEQAAWFGLAPPGQLPAPDQQLAHGMRLVVGGSSFEVRHAPGHSPGSVCLVGSGVAFSGDVLFAGSIGRTDLPGGDFETLMASIERELLTLPDDTILYSGHGPETTIGRERRTNPFLTGVNRIA